MADIELPIDVGRVTHTHLMHRSEFEEGAEFTVPGYGVLRTKGREYTFLPTATYRGAKGYPDEIVGVWG